MKNPERLVIAFLFFCIVSIVGATGALGEPGAALSRRLIVELTSPPVARQFRPEAAALSTPPAGRGKLSVAPAAAAAYRSRLRVEQDQAVSRIQAAVGGARISRRLDERGVEVENRYTDLFNGLAIDINDTDIDTAMAELRKIPGVRQVYRERAYSPAMYASLPLIDAAALWNHPAVGFMENAGRGIKVASMDGGVHHEAPMFDGTGFDYPEGFGPAGRGDPANNNGKIIVSRGYFRADDPPRTDPDHPERTDGNTWPGYWGTSHGVHTSGTMAGNPVRPAEYLGYQGEPPLDIGGIAPGAWIMSYRVFYEAVSGNQSFHTAEGLAALEDIVADGADVLNNSWGSGPISMGGEGDPLDAALLNAVRAGIFVSMSAGNSGPGHGTVDHPSDAYISVAATTTTGSISAGRMKIPEGGEELQDIAYGIAEFGRPLLPGVTDRFAGVAAANIDNGGGFAGDNVTGCGPWDPAIDFNGRAVLISRGTCVFSDKVRYAQQRGAGLAVIYNLPGDDTTMSMACGGQCDDIAIPAVFIGNHHGLALVAHVTALPEAPLEMDTRAYQAGATPDRIIDFSSRGPAVGNVLKPDIAAPGVNILSQGYTPNAAGEGRHLLYGQVSGTSMAAPHVAGAAAVLRQIHPEWPVGHIKSALMTTAKFMEIYNADDTPAQPLDMGAGRLELSRAADPGVILEPVSLSYGLVGLGAKKSLAVSVLNISPDEETYALSSVFTGNGFAALSGVAGLTIEPESLTVPAGGTAQFTVTFNSMLGRGLGDNQGYIVLQGNRGHEAHLPAWARVIAKAESKVLVIDNDFSTGSPSYVREGIITEPCPDYLAYYTAALDELGISYDVWDADRSEDPDSHIPETARLLGYEAIIYFTGDNDYRFTPAIDWDRLTEYANSGGTLIAMGQDLSRVAGYTPDVSGDLPFFFANVLGGRVVSSPTGSVAWPDGVAPVPPDRPILAATGAPPTFADISLDLSGNAAGDGAGNQLRVDELADQPNIDLSSVLPGTMLFTPVLRYPGENNLANGAVAMLHRDNIDLDRDYLLFPGRTVYTSFGLEGVNNLAGSTSRAELLRAFLNWGLDEPAAAVRQAGYSLGATTFSATLTSEIEGGEAVGYRWDFGDGTDHVTTATSTATHVYAAPGNYTVRVAITDSRGARTLAATTATGAPPPAEPAASPAPSGGGGGGGACFITTARE